MLHLLGRQTGPLSRKPGFDYMGAAYGGITAVNPFQPLPTHFRGEYLALRFRFLYNPDRNQLR